MSEQKKVYKLINSATKWLASEHNFFGELEKDLDNLKKAIKEKKLTIGTEKTIKALKKGEAKEVFISKNCPELIRKEIKNYAKIANIPIVEMKENNKEIGTICKKPFAINLCSY